MCPPSWACTRPSKIPATPLLSTYQKWSRERRFPVLDTASVIHEIGSFAYSWSAGFCRKRLIFLGCFYYFRSCFAAFSDFSTLFIFICAPSRSLLAVAWASKKRVMQLCIASNLRAVVVVHGIACLRTHVKSKFYWTVTFLVYTIRIRYERKRNGPIWSCSNAKSPKAKHRARLLNWKRWPWYGWNFLSYMY